MKLYQIHKNRHAQKLFICFLGIFLISLILHFWGIDRFNILVFDEVYYAKYAKNYLTKTPFFDAHPPLGKYLIAIGIWIGSRIPFGQDSLNNLTGSLLSPFSYRWLNALTGSLIPLVVAGLAYQLSHRRSYALIAGLFTAVDGLLLVESRYALINIYLVFFGLLGQWFFLLALDSWGIRQWFWLALAGIGFGASAAVKWNGLGFLLGIYLIWVAAFGIGWVQNRKQRRSQESEVRKTQDLKSSLTPLQKLTQLNFLAILLNLAIIPVLIYSLAWIPHLQLKPEIGFWEVHQQIWSSHQRIGSGPDVHSYCSPWYSWPVMWRPIAYFYETARNTEEIVPAYPPLPAGAGKVIYDVHAMGNPALWWLSTAAIFLLLLLLAHDFFRIGMRKSTPTPQTWIGLYLVFNYAANLLPWIKVTRCTFLYHYMGSSVFAGLALAWIVDRWLHSNLDIDRQAGITIILLIVIAFMFWLPIYLGLPLSSEGYRIRMLFPNWI
ncbi:MAG: dolichyl-phosphate-mannose--protein mannosyltransferase [Xenococcaceae cyanobacterium]